MGNLCDENSDKLSGRREFLAGASAIAGGLVLSLANVESAAAKTETSALAADNAVDLEEISSLSGNVYVFNFSNSAMRNLTINNHPVGALGAWSPSGKSQYLPQGIAVERSGKAPSSLSRAGFSQDGSNEIFVEWDDGSGRPIDYSTSVARHDPSMREDLLLYINPSQAILFDQFGKLLETFKAG